ncbi:adenosine deaminase [Planctomycetota bacterium]
MGKAMQNFLTFDPVTALLDAGDRALTHFVRRDLLEEDAGPIQQVWELPEVIRVLGKQRDDGAWDYTGAILSLVIKAGYENDPRVERGMRWLLSMRQDDGGWTIPILCGGFDRETQNRLTTEYAEPIAPDRSKPFSHNWTGLVLRAFAAHPAYRASPEAHAAGVLLKSRFFKKDVYSSYQAASYWVKFQFPYWWNHLLAALDSLSWLGFAADDPDIQRGLDWFRDNQERTGLWRLTYEQGRVLRDAPQTRTEARWVSLAICRVLRRFLG